jgi:hypothetical protein
MTFVRRRYGNDHHIQAALAALNAGRFQDARDTMSHALYEDGSNADYFWLRGRSLWKLARQQDDSGFYSQTINDFRASITIDPTPVLRHDGLWPESRWALPAYAHVLRKNLSEAGYNGGPTVRAANAIAKIGKVNPETMDATWAEVEGLLLAFATDKTTFSFCPFRKALCAIGWEPSRDGYALVTEQDIQRSARPSETPDYWGDYSQVNETLLPCKLSEDEITRLNDVCSVLFPKDIAVLQMESQSPDRFIRAASCVLLCVRGAPPPMPLMLDELRDRNSHRLIRVATLHSLSRSLEQSHLGNDSLVAEAVSRLIQAATQDKAAVCRREAVHSLERIADTLRRLNREAEWEMCRAAIEAALHDNDREVVVAATEARRKYGEAGNEVIDYIAGISWQTRHHFDSAMLCWQALSEKTKTVFAITKPGNSVRRHCWDEFTGMFSFPHEFVRTTGVEAASFLVGKVEFTDELRSLLLERSWMDDSRDVRDLAKSVLARLTP